MDHYGPYINDKYDQEHANQLPAAPVTCRKVYYSRCPTAAYVPVLMFRCTAVVLKFSRQMLGQMNSHRSRVDEDYYCPLGPMCQGGRWCCRVSLVQPVNGKWRSRQNAHG
jgi:hypothetical protein